MAKSTTISKADRTLATDQGLKAVLVSNGWVENPIVTSTHHGKRTEDFTVFSRSILNPKFSPNGTLGKIASQTGVSQTQQNQAFSGVSTLGAKSPMGVTNSIFAPNVQNGVVSVDGRSPEGQRIWRELDLYLDEQETGVINWPAMRLSFDTSTGFFQVPVGRPYAPVQSQPVQSSPNVPAVQQTQAITTISDITSIQRMQMQEPSFVLAFDSEFYYDASKQRRVLTWQFAFIDPEIPDEVQELLVCSRSEKTLPFSMILNYILETYRIYPQFVEGADEDGYAYRRTRRWEVPVLDRMGRVVRKQFDKFDDAVQSCSDPAVQSALQKAGPRVKADFDYVLMIGDLSLYQTQ